MEPDTFLVNGDADFGYWVKATLTNAGPNGDVSIQATLTTSEGEWWRSQRMFLRQDQPMPVSFSFPEPTINATNVQGKIGCNQPG